MDRETWTTQKIWIYGYHRYEQMPEACFSTYIQCHALWMLKGLHSASKEILLQ